METAAARDRGTTTGQVDVDVRDSGSVDVTGSTGTVDVENATSQRRRRGTEFRARDTAADSTPTTTSTTSGGSTSSNVSETLEQQRRRAVRRAQQNEVDTTGGRSTRTFDPGSSGSGPGFALTDKRSVSEQQTIRRAGQSAPSAGEIPAGQLPEINIPTGLGFSVEDALKSSARAFDSNVVQPAAGVAGGAVGTVAGRGAGSATRSFVSGVGTAVNPFGIVAEGKDVAEGAVAVGAPVVQGDVGEALRRGGQAGQAILDTTQQATRQAQSNPARAVGSLAGGFAAGTAARSAVRGRVPGAATSRRVLSGATDAGRRLDDSLELQRDPVNLLRDERAQTGGQSVVGLSKSEGSTGTPDMSAEDVVEGRQARNLDARMRRRGIQVDVSTSTVQRGGRRTGGVEAFLDDVRNRRVAELDEQTPDVDARQVEDVRSRTPSTDLREAAARSATATRTAQAAGGLSLLREAQRRQAVLDDEVVGGGEDTTVLDESPGSDAAQRQDVRQEAETDIMELVRGRRGVGRGEFDTTQTPEATPGDTFPVIGIPETTPDTTPTTTPTTTTTPGIDIPGIPTPDAPSTPTIGDPDSRDDDDGSNRRRPRLPDFNFPTVGPDETFGSSTVDEDVFSTGIRDFDL